MPDINKATHLGTVMTNPSLQNLGNSNTPCAIFTLKFEERWEDKNGRPQSRANLAKFEALGTKAHWVKANVKAGKRFLIDSYFRSEQINGKEDNKFRIFHIEEVKSSEFNEGVIRGSKATFKQAISILETSSSIEIAKAKLEVLLESL